MHHFNKKHLASKMTKVLLSVCVITILTGTFLFMTGSQAFAANTHQTKSLTSTQYDRIWPTWNYLGCGGGWNQAWDLNGGGYYQYAYTTGSQACASAVWNDSGNTTNRYCEVWVVIPVGFATANISYGFYDARGNLMFRVAVNQNNVSGPIRLTYSVWNVHHILISSNNGQNGNGFNGPWMAAGEMDFNCIIQ